MCQTEDASLLPSSGEAWFSDGAQWGRSGAGVMKRRN